MINILHADAACKCGWLPTFICSHIQYGKYRCPYIRTKYNLKVTNNELEYVPKDEIKTNG